MWLFEKKTNIRYVLRALPNEISGGIATSLIFSAWNAAIYVNQMSDKHVKYMLSKVPRARFLELNEFSSLVCWLSSEENSFSTAAVFDISGGRSTY